MWSNISNPHPTDWKTLMCSNSPVRCCSIMYCILYIMESTLKGLNCAMWSNSLSLSSYKKKINRNTWSLCYNWGKKLEKSLPSILSGELLVFTSHMIRHICRPVCGRRVQIKPLHLEKRSLNLPDSKNPNITPPADQIHPGDRKDAAPG